jgi:hypothetical protein
MDKQIIIVKPGSLSEQDKEKLSKAGNVVIEHKEALEITFRPFSSQEYVFTNCNRCGERIYLLKERLSALQSGKAVFYCSHGHSQAYV